MCTFAKSTSQQVNKTVISLTKFFGYRYRSFNQANLRLSTNPYPGEIILLNYEELEGIPLGQWFVSGRQNFHQQDYESHYLRMQPLQELGQDAKRESVNGRSIYETPF